MNWSDALIITRNDPEGWRTGLRQAHEIIAAMAEQVEANRLAIQELRTKLSELTQHYKSHTHKTSEGMNVWRPQRADYLS